MCVEFFYGVKKKSQQNINVNIIHWIRWKSHSCPTITRKPAAFPRHWPCLTGRFRAFRGLLRTVKLTWASMVLVQVHWVPTGFGFTAQLMRKTCPNLTTAPFEEVFKGLRVELCRCRQTGRPLTSQIARSHFLLPCPRAKTLKESTCSLVFSRSVSSLLILCNWGKTHLFRNYCISHILLSESHHLSHVFFPLYVVKNAL